MIKYILIITILTITTIIAIDRYIVEVTKPMIYSDIEKLPTKRAALLLGTTKYLKGGYRNYFYTYRIEAVVALWRAKKIKAVVVSGDNSTKRYDETTTMYNDLIKAGVPKQYITRDYAGFRTLDSIVRAEAIFDLDDYIVVSQRFHLERALYIAGAKGQRAVGYVAKDIAGTDAAMRMKYREYLARVKAFLDLYILHIDPKFYGKKEKVEYKK